MTNDQEKEVDTNQTEPTVEQINYKDMFLRLNADFQNYKKRVEKERSEWMLVAQISILKSLLPILDDLNRAIKTADSIKETQPESQQEWLEGFKLIQKNLTKELDDLGVKEIATDGQFNPELHEALVQVDDQTKPSEHIVEVLSKGYTFQGKVISHAQVSVAK
jgi:molecular chaperone GrpE